MAALLPTPEPQFCDADGLPYAAGTLQTLIPGTSTPKTTWSESTGTTANTNPIVLDAAGRCVVYGDGAYRLILKDALGNLVWDQDSNTIVSLAMAPVALAPTIADAQALLGIVDYAAAIAAETDARIAADNNLNTAIEDEQTARIAADNNLNTAIATEQTRALAAEAALAAAGPFTGYTWHDVSGSRALATDYTNSHSKVMLVNVVGNSGAGGWIQGIIDGVAVSQWLSGNGNWTHTVSLVVPAGSTYRATVTGGAAVLVWAEFY